MKTAMESTLSIPNGEQEYRPYKTNCDKPLPPPTEDSASIFSIPSDRTSMTTIGKSNWSIRTLYSDNSDEDSDDDISDEDRSTRSSLSSFSRWETTSLLEGDLDGMEFPARDSMELYSNASFSVSCLGSRWTIKKSPKKFSWGMLIPKFHGSGGIEMPKKGNVVRFEGRRAYSKLGVKVRNFFGRCMNKRG
jgi:hypothetical protein